MDELDKKIQELTLVIEEGTKAYNKALKDLDEALARIIKTEDRKKLLITKFLCKN